MNELIFGPLAVAGRMIAMVALSVIAVACRRLRSGAFEDTGIAPATLARIIARHGGGVWARGDTGRGATVYSTVGQT